MSYPQLGRFFLNIPSGRVCSHHVCARFWSPHVFCRPAQWSRLHLQDHSRCLHTTPTLTAVRHKNSKKKLVKPVRVNPKALKLALVTIYPNMTVAEVAAAIGRDIDHVFEILMYIPNGDKYEHETSVIHDFGTIKEIVKKSGMRFITGSREQKKKEKENKDIVRQPPPDPAVLVRRSPVVTIMGHVDHGKTTLLDSLRKSNVVDQEFGGITQHIGAFSVKLSSGETITFLDTPGHSAFSAMRARGAQLTDIIILVVAADDGVMNQTKESIQHARDANVPVIVAINKTDKPAADIERTKKMLLEHQVVLEDFGGDVQAVPISALKGTNLELLQEAVVTQAEVMELKSDSQGLVEGRVVEAKTDAGRGKLATAVIQRGTLKRGDLLVAGTTWVKVRGMFSDQGKPIQEAPPATPVEIIGWKDIPAAGEEILQVSTMQELKEVIDWRVEQEQLKKLETDQVVIEEKRQEHGAVYKEQVRRRREEGWKKSKAEQKRKEIISQHEGPQLSLVLKGDVDGTVEAILDTLDGYHSKLCRLDLVHYGVGNVTENDVQLAEAFSGEIFGFNVQAPESVVRVAKNKSVPIKTHNVIYKLFDDLVSSLSKKLPVLEEENIIGEAEVKAVFKVKEGKKTIAVAGCRCLKGSLHRKEKIRVVRGDSVIYDGDLSSLKHFKNEVDVIKKGLECGLCVNDGSVDFRPGDIVMCYEVKSVEQEIDWQPGV